MVGPMPKPAPGMLRDVGESGLDLVKLAKRGGMWGLPRYSDSLSFGGPQDRSVELGTSEKKMFGGGFQGFCRVFSFLSYFSQEI